MALSLRRPTSQRTASPSTAADALRPRWRQRRRRRGYALSLLLVVVVGLTLFMLMLQWQGMHVLEVVAPPTTSVPTRTYTSPPPRTHVARRSSATSFPVPPANILRTTKKADEDVADSLHVGTFTVVMVLHTWQDVRGQLLATLDRWSRYFFRSGLVQHAHLLELLLYIPITTQHTRTAAEVAELVLRRWAVEDAETLKQCGHDDDHHHQQQQGNHTDTKWQRWRKLVRVVVAPAPRHSSEKLAAMQAPAQLFAAVEAVRSEYVVVADLRWLPPPSHPCNTSSSHVHDDQHVNLGALMSMGLQALSRNELADLPILLDEDTPLHVDDADVFRLAHTPMALPSHTHTLTKANNNNTDAPQLLAQRWSAFMRYLRREYNNENNISHDTQHMPMRQMVMQEAPLPSWWRHAAVLDGLPARHYGTSLAYHCAAAPRYALQLPLAPFLRPTTAHHHHPRISATDAHHVSFVPMCEVLISRWSGMDEFVGPPLLFHTHICDAWRRWVFVDGEVGDADRAAPSTSVLAPPTTSPGEKDALRTLLYRPPTTNHCGTLCCFHWSMEWKRALLRARKRHGRGPRVRMDNSAHIGSAGVAAFAELLWPRPRINRTAEELKVEALQSLRHFLPPSMHANLSHAHDVLRQRISAKVDPIHVKYVVEQRRRQKLRRRAGDAAVVCLPSNSCAVDGAPMMFRTRWYLERMAMRCRRRRHECMGDENTTPQRSMDMMAYYLGRTGRWSKGAYRVCSGAGGFMYDPDQVLP